jgi:hypothetical protein
MEGSIVWGFLWIYQQTPDMRNVSPKIWNRSLPKKKVFITTDKIEDCTCFRILQQSLSAFIWSPGFYHENHSKWIRIFPCRSFIRRHSARGCHVTTTVMNACSYNAVFNWFISINCVSRIQNTESHGARCVWCMTLLLLLLLLLLNMPSSYGL